jgi:hypothetical protein
MEAMEKCKVINLEELNSLRHTAFNKEEQKLIRDISFRLKFYPGTQYFKTIFQQASDMLHDIGDTDDIDVQVIAISRWKNWVKHLNIDVLNFLYEVADEKEI